MKIMVSKFWAACQAICIWTCLSGVKMMIEEILSLEGKPTLSLTFYVILNICYMVGSGVFAGVFCICFYMCIRIIIINETGVTARVLFLKRTIPWERVKEWGGGTSHIYGSWGREKNALYFSTKVLTPKEKLEVCQDKSLRLLRPDSEDTVFFVKYTAKRWAYVNSLEVMKAQRQKEKEASYAAYVKEQEDGRNDGVGENQ